MAGVLMVGITLAAQSVNIPMGEKPDPDPDCHPPPPYLDRLGRSRSARSRRANQRTSSNERKSASHAQRDPGTTGARAAQPAAAFVAPHEDDKRYAIAARGLKKSFRAGQIKVEVLKGIDLLIEPGEIAGDGPSGSAVDASAAVSGLLKPDEGSVVALSATISGRCRVRRSTGSG
jgi:ABC-type glutathione transport system ATPase component